MDMILIHLLIIILLIKTVVLQTKTHNLIQHTLNHLLSNVINDQFQMAIDL